MIVFEGVRKVYHHIQFCFDNGVWFFISASYIDYYIESQYLPTWFRTFMNLIRSMLERARIVTTQVSLLAFRSKPQTLNPKP